MQQDYLLVNDIVYPVTTAVAPPVACCCWSRCCARLCCHVTVCQGLQGAELCVQLHRGMREYVSVMVVARQQGQEGFQAMQCTVAHPVRAVPYGWCVLVVASRHYGLMSVLFSFFCPQSRHHL